MPAVLSPKGVTALCSKPVSASLTSLGARRKEKRDRGTRGDEEEPPPLLLLFLYGRLGS